MLLFGSVGSLVADRVPKRRLWMVTQTLHMVVPLTLLSLALEGTPRPLDGLPGWSPSALRQFRRLPDSASCHGDGRSRIGS